MSNKQIIQELKGLVNLYIALRNATTSADLFKTAHKNNQFSAQDLQQGVAANGRELEKGLLLFKNNFAAGSKQQETVQAMANSVQSYQRYAINHIPTGKPTSSPTLPSSMQLTR